MSDTKAVAAKAWVEVDFSPDPGFQLLFDGIKATEELGRPFLYELDLSSGTLIANIGDIVGSSGTLWLSQSADSADDRYFNGVVTKVVSHGLAGGAYRYHVELRPWIWLLTRITDCKIFNNESPFKIITDVFRAAGFSDFSDKRQASSGDQVLEYCVQYRETSFDFVSRLMEQYGLYYYFTHTKTQHTLVISDDPNSNSELSKAIPFVFEQTEMRTVGDHIWEWSAAMALHSGTFTFQDYNFTTPTADLTAKTLKPATHASYNKLEVYEYPGIYGVAADGKTLTDVRIQAITKERTVIHGASNARGLHPGWKFTLSDHPEKSVNRDYQVIRTEWSMALAEGSSTVDGETVDTYRVAFSAIPGDVNFRLERFTPRPHIPGLQTATVVGASGSEIDTDEYGRILVKFYWDRADVADDKRTCRIRCAQASAGNLWGSMFIPRVGQEVVVEFLEGNPDRPLVTGVVYNANMKVPYDLPANQTRTTIKTNSSKGGGGFNELRFEDKKDSEEVFFQAQKDYNKKVLNNETVTIHQDTTTTVEEGNRSVTISKGDDSHTISAGNRTVKVNKADSLTVDTGNRSVTVTQGNDSLTVSTGNHSITVSTGKSSITATQAIELTVGANSIKIDTSGITINGMKVGVQSTTTMSLQASASFSVTAPMIGLN